MNLIRAIESTLGCKDSNGVPRGWLVYYNSKDEIREVKSLYNPTKYTGARTVYNDADLVAKLKEYKQNKKR
tara:strand:+ start:135 stop:347 length:213 start_codon:yes stop_codon:yes gene_type:complete